MSVGSPEEKLALHLLGSPRIIWQGTSLKIVRRQARAALYRVAAEPTAVPRERLAFLFWPDEPDAKARRNLSRLLSYLRKELPYPDCVLVNRRTVRLNPQRAWSDCRALEEAHESGELVALEESAERYRGHFLEGFSAHGAPEFAKWREQRAAELESVYLDVLSRLITVLSERNQIQAAVTYAKRYLAVDNLAEELHRRLITLYGRAGDRASATRQFEQCSLLLERELGVTPLPETRDAYETALHDGASPLPTQVRSPSWSVLPSLELPLVGRDEAFRALGNAATRLASGGLILISGEPGVGKSRLMQELATASESWVLAGNNPPGEQTVAYSAITQVLRQALSHRKRWQGIRPVWLAEVGRLLPEMGDVFPELPEPVEVEASQAQARLFEGIIRCVLGLAAQGPVLLCLDDVHWADGGTMGWLTALAPGLAGSDVCIMATYRSARGGAVADVKRAYARRGLLAEVPLWRLTAAAVAGILEQVPERPPDLARLAKRIHHATGGNTFFVLETVRALLEAERLAEPAAELPLASTVEAAIGRRLEKLSPLGRQVLETAAVLGTGLRFTLLEETAGRSELEVAEGLDEVVGRQLLVGGEAHRFSHDLVRQVTYEEISPWRRRILHRRAAGALEAAVSSDGERPWATIAGHYDAAGEAAEAIRCYEAAATTAGQIYAHEEASDHLRRAIELADEGEEQVLRRLYEALADNLANAGTFAEAEEAYRAALALAPDEDQLQKAALERKLAATLPPQQREGDAETIYRRALERLDGRPAPEVEKKWYTIRLDILLGLLDALYFQLRPEAMMALREQTQALLDEVGTAEQHATFYARLSQMTFLQNRYQAPAENVILARKSLARAQESGGAWLVARQQFHVGFQLLWEGSLDEAGERLRKALAMAEELGDSWLQTQSLVYLTILYRLLGNRSQVTSHMPALVETLKRISYPIYVGASEANRAWLHYRDREWREAQALAEAAVAAWAVTNYPFEWLAHWVLLAVGLRQGRLPGAVEAARAMLDPRQRQLPEGVAGVLEAVVAAWEAEDKEKAREALSRAVDLAQEHGYL